MYIAGVLTGMFICWVQDLCKTVDHENASRKMAWGINGLVLEAPPLQYRPPPVIVNNRAYDLTTGPTVTWKITRYCWAYGEDDLCRYGPQMPLGGGAVNVPGRIIPFDDRGYSCYTGGQCVALLSETGARERRVIQWGVNPIVVKPPDGLPVIPSITFTTK